MGLHPSLKRDEKLGTNRTVLKRTERIKWLMEKGLWKDDSPVTGLPKIKVVKLKAVKKEKAKEEGTEKTAEASPSAAKPKAA